MGLLGLRNKSPKGVYTDRPEINTVVLGGTLTQEHVEEKKPDSETHPPCKSQRCLFGVPDTNLCSGTRNAERTDGAIFATVNPYANRVTS